VTSGVGDDGTRRSEIEGGVDGRPPARFRSRQPSPDPPSPKEPETEQIVADLVALAVDARDIVAIGRTRFLDPDGALYRHAADGLIVKVHELCGRLPDAFRTERPDVPWAAIRGMRNRIGHNYRLTDYEVVWVALERDLPALARSVSPVRPSDPAPPAGTSTR
jgi:hypothetical protein